MGLVLLKLILGFFFNFVRNVGVVNLDDHSHHTNIAEKMVSSKMSKLCTYPT